MNFDAAALAYVRYVLEENNLKPGALARKAGISASTLTRALNDPEHKFKLSMSTLQKIADFTGISPAPFLDSKSTVDLTLTEAHQPAIYKPGERPAPMGLHEAGYNFTFVIGDVAAGVWIDPAPFNYMEYGPLHLTHTIKSSKECFAYVVRDASANMIAENGDILFCLKTDEADVERYIEVRPEADYGAGPVIVERRSKDAFKVEHTARLIRRRRDGVPGWELVSAHYEDHFAGKKERGAGRPLIERVFIDKYGGNDEFRVVGVVQNVIRGDTTDVLNWLLFDHK
ncbi:helix-turn-helix transcriptional regulator [Bradyrhizobium sp. LA6.1]|uniref:helix-turn-helix domain-containing protein n=1 Tax=Bradyrhizobium sp. LA6.1 TaxID=3156378 RepID=UPI0033911FA4